MTNLLERIRMFYRPAKVSRVADLIKFMGDSPSIKTLEAVLKHYKAEVKQILGKDLLEWMKDNDQTTFETEDLKVSIKTYVSAKMENSEDGFNWLIANQYGDSIKDNLEFPKGEFSDAAREALDALGLSYTKKSGIHPQYLKKIMSMRLEAGEMLPDEADGIVVGYYDECVVKEK